MFNVLKNKLYFMKLNLLFNEGFKKGDILPFEDDLYDRLSKVYFNGIPVSIQIKYLNPVCSPGQCEDRSWFITMGFDDALWVSGDNKDLELRFGKDGAWHFWVEHDGWVYEPALLYKFKKKLYYKMFMPSNVIERRAEKYKNDEWYQEVTNTTLDDLKPGGKDRCRLITSLPLIKEIAEREAKLSCDDSFLRDLNKHLEDIRYDYKQISDELNSKINEHIRRRTN